MDFQAAVKKCLLKDYMNFSGRASRSELWYFVLFLFIINFAIGVASTFSEGFFGVIYGLFWIGTLLPSIAVWVRRLHDIDKSGAWVILILVPFIGLIFAIIWGCQKGTAGSNNFGPDPLLSLDKY